MQWLNNLNIRTKLMVSFMAILMLTVLLGVFMFYKLTKISTIADDVAKTQVPAMLSIAKINDFFGSYRRGELLEILSDKQEDINKYSKRNQETHEKLKNEILVYEKLIDTAEEKKHFADFTDALQSYLAENPKILALALENKDVEASELARSASSKQFNLALKALEAVMASQVKQTTSHSVTMSVVSDSSRTSMVYILIACVVIGMIEALVIAGMLSAPLRDLAKKSEQIAAGDLNVTVSANSRDEIGLLSASFVTMVNNLRDVIGKVRETSLLVSSAATELSATSEQIASGSEEVASQASAVATASEEMSATTSDIARNCHDAADSAHKASQAAHAGSVVVEQTVAVMNRISVKVQETAAKVDTLGRQSDQIGEIVGTIEDIADQTNLLALNAAIEAARAGEQGRGFAVVADEVRALAERTSKATKEIGTMIRNIQNETKEAVAAMEAGVMEVANGTEEAAKSGQALHDILSMANAVTEQASQIATAAEQQTATTQEISSNIHQITDVVHQSAASAQQSATASHQLAELADNLKNLIARFKS
ncbi:MAG: methyl-accepting chemotaxis protein [Geobacteraceae bacterium]|nr:methyl-accepting chemotaxis protein [Geobacteraceae bacterium]